MIESGRRGVDDVLCNHPEACFSQPDWLEIIENDDVHFEGREQVEWIMKSLLRGVNDKTAPMVYQTLVSSVLLPTNLTDPNQAMLSPTPHVVRVQVEQAQSDILARICRRWLNICQEGGFDNLGGWVIKTITDAIAVSVRIPKDSGLCVRNITMDGDSDTYVSALSHSLHSTRITPTEEEANDVVSSSASMFTAWHVFSTARTTTTGSIKNSIGTTSSGAFLTADDHSVEINSKASSRARVRRH